MNSEKTDTRDLKYLGNSLNRLKKNIDTLMNALKDTPDLLDEFKSELINYILGA